jgi:hypothetical protein
MSKRRRDSEMKETRTIEEPPADPGRKQQVLRRATSHSFPTADIEEMLAQIEQGYSEERA